MSDEFENQVPGVTLHHKSDCMMQQTATGLRRVELVLECTISDEKVWAEIDQRFKEGLRVFTAEDFHIEVMNAMRRRLQELERERNDAKAALRRSESELTEARGELSKYKNTLGAFGRALNKG